MFKVRSVLAMGVGEQGEFFARITSLIRLRGFAYSL
jgi:hypothetical protein